MFKVKVHLMRVSNIQYTLYQIHLHKVCVTFLGVLFMWDLNFMGPGNNIIVQTR